jgi:hypothetical protein
MHWWLLKCVSYQRCRLLNTFCRHWLKQEPKQPHPSSNDTPRDPVITTTCSAAAGPRNFSSVCGSIKFTGPDEAEGLWLYQVQSTCIIGQVSKWIFINMYKSVTGTWNVFGWNNPTLQDHVFWVARPWLGSAGNDYGYLSLSQKTGSCGIRLQPKPPRREHDRQCISQAGNPGMAAPLLPERARQLHYRHQPGRELLSP